MQLHAQQVEIAVVDNSNIPSMHMSPVHTISLISQMITAVFYVLSHYQLHHDYLLNKPMEELGMGLHSGAIKSKGELSEVIVLA